MIASFFPGLSHVSGFPPAEQALGHWPPVRVIKTTVRKHASFSVILIPPCLVPTLLSQRSRRSDLQTSDPEPSELWAIKRTPTSILSNCNLCLEGITVISYVAGAHAKAGMEKTFFLLCFSFVVQDLESNNLFYSVMWCILSIWEAIRENIFKLLGEKNSSISTTRYHFLLH